MACRVESLASELKLINLRNNRSKQASGRFRSPGPRPLKKAPESNQAGDCTALDLGAEGPWPKAGLALVIPKVQSMGVGGEQAPCTVCVWGGHVSMMTPVTNRKSLLVIGSTEKREGLVPPVSS